jgi:hypothetical protein
MADLWIGEHGSEAVRDSPAPFYRWNTKFAKKLGKPAVVAFCGGFSAASPARLEGVRARILRYNYGP